MFFPARDTLTSNTFLNPRRLIFAAVVPMLVIGAKAPTLAGSAATSGTITVTFCTVDADTQAPLVDAAVEAWPTDDEPAAVTGTTGADGCVALNIATSTSIDDGSEIPGRFDVSPAFPNPVTQATEVPFVNAESQVVVASLFDVGGRRVAESAGAAIAPGNWSVQIDASGLPAGIYFYQIRGVRALSNGRFVKLSGPSGAVASIAVVPGIAAPSASKSSAGVATTITAALDGYTPVETQMIVEDGEQHTLALAAEGGGGLPAVPTPVTPANGSSGVAFSSVNMSWGAADGATAYDLELATDDAFATIVESVAGISSTTHNVTGLSASTTYYWHVRSGNADGSSDWSSVYNFTTASDGGGGSDPPGGDTADSFPMDRGDEGTGTPGTYKGLPLRLIDNGEPTVTPVNDVIGVVCIGMSNSSQECSYYIGQVNGAFAADINPQVKVVDCAVGGHAIEKWIDPDSDETLWNECINRKLGNQAGITADQVRVIYHKAADMCTSNSSDPCDKGDGAALPPYPDPSSDYFNFYDNLDALAPRIKSFFPNVEAVYTTSRSYGGFSPREVRGEPLSYEEGHALNLWLENNPSVDGMWFGWGPYIWAGECGNGLDNASGVCYVVDDYEADGVHPSTSGEDKVANMIHNRFLQHAWYRK